MRIAARFDPIAWDEDLARASTRAAAAAHTARQRYERDGVPIAELRPCDPEARDGTRLERCVKAQCSGRCQEPQSSVY